MSYFCHYIVYSSSNYKVVCPFLVNLQIQRVMHYLTTYLTPFSRKKRWIKKLLFLAQLAKDHVRRVWRYQRGNQNPYIEEEQTTQWPKEKAQEGPPWLWLYGSWIYNYICNQWLSPLTLWVGIPVQRSVLDTTLCDKVCQWLHSGGILPVLRFPSSIKLTVTI